MIKHKSTVISIVLLFSTIFALIYITTPVKAALIITSVTPSTVSNNVNATITVSGNDFTVGSVVSLDGFGSLSTSYFSNTTLLAIVPAGTPVGLYTVTVINPDSTTASLTNSLNIIAQTPTETATSTVEPPNSYERPVLVINDYGISQDRIAPGNSFSLYVTLYNAGQHYAKNIVASFIPGDLIPRETGGVVAVGEIAPGNRIDFAQPLSLKYDFYNTVVSINMLVAYVDEDGITYNETFIITLPVFQSYSSWATSTPTATLSPTPSVKPQLVITSYSTNITQLQPGAQFNLTLSIKNMGNSSAKGITMIVGGGVNNSGGDGGTQQPGGISGGSGEFSNFAPIGSSNVQSLGELSPGKDLAAEQLLIVNTSTAPGAYPLKISFVYTDEKNHSYTDDQVITLLVYRPPLLDIDFYQEVGALFVGQPNMLPLQVVNLGRYSVILGNMRVTAESGQFMNNSILVGTLEPGGYFTLDATFIPDQPGQVELLVTIDYTDDFNQLQVISETLTVEVMDQPVIEPPMDNGETGNGGVIQPQPETFLQKLWRLFLGLIGLDSGVDSTPSSIDNQPLETAVPEGLPITVPAQPLKGP
jgi:hypothetical protein